MKKSSGASFTNPISSSNKLPGAAKGGPSGVKQPMTGKAPSAALSKPPGSMPKKR